MKSIASVRAHFPALESGVAFFDGPGGTQVPTSVVESMVDYLLHDNANTHWAYPTSQRTDARLAEARSDLAALLGCGPQEVVFGANMTTLTFHLGRCLARGWRTGDELVITELDHHANQDPWRQLAREHGLEIRAVPFDPATGELNYAALAQAITPRTRLVAVGAASNALGTINDLARVRELAGTALLFVDAVHYAPHGFIDVEAWGCDILACSAYKFYGPHVGVLYLRRRWFDGLDAARLRPASDQAPEVLETGTLNHEGIVGAGAAVRFLADLGEATERRPALRGAMQALHDQGQHLLERLWNALGAMAGVCLYGPTPDRPRTPTVVFTVKGFSSRQVAERLSRAGVYVSHGDFYATTVLERLGLAESGLVRAGCACYTDDQDVERLLAGVRELTT